jgi:transcription elongation factor SPT5
LDSENSQ